MDIKDFYKKQRIVITGGSSGLGRAFAIRASKLGAQVVVVARGKELLSTLKRTYPSIHTVEADISNKATIHSVAAQALAQLETVTMLVNNASELGPTPLRLLLDTDCEDFEHVLQTNLLGAFRLTKLLLPSMLLHGGGTVLNISSDAAVSPYPRWGAYSVSKAALDQLSRVWHAELQAHGIQFFALDPGDMYTPMHLLANPEASANDLLNPEDVAHDLIQFLSNPRNGIALRLSHAEWNSKI